MDIKVTLEDLTVKYPFVIGFGHRRKRLTEAEARKLKNLLQVALDSYSARKSFWADKENG